MQLRLLARAASLAVVGSLILATAQVAAADEARLRVLHGSPDAPAVDVYADGTKVLSDVPFGAISDYLTVPAGDHQVQVFAAGTTTGAVIDATVTLEAGASYTVAATNALAAIEAQVIVDAPATTAGAALVRAIHLAADAPAVDVAPRGAAADAAVVTNLTYPDATDYLSLDAGSYDLDVRLAGTTTVALELPALDVAAGTAYSVFVIGSAADPAIGGNALQAVVAVDGTAPAATMPPTDALGTDATPTVAGGTAFAAALLLLAAVAGGSVTALVLARRAGHRD
jgi:hypothetical protein